MQAERIVASINAALQDATGVYERRYRVPATPAYVALTGGLSCNAYIKAAVVARVREQHGDSVRVVLPAGNEG
jgi:hypothetical protein